MKSLCCGVVIIVCLLFFSSLAWSAPAEVPQTGQDVCYDSSNVARPCAGSGQDGDFQAGVLLPSPRFTDRGNGTVIDNLTGLIWLKDARCFGGVIWADAVNAANTLQSGDCGLSDGSVAGWWRLPNIRELKSLINFNYRGPALSNTAGTGQWQEGDPFTNVLGYNNSYWSSTTNANHTDEGWNLSLDHGGVGNGDKNDIDYADYNVWPVRELRID